MKSSALLALPRLVLAAALLALPPALAAAAPAPRPTTEPAATQDSPDVTALPEPPATLPGGELAGPVFNSRHHAYFQVLAPRPPGQVTALILAVFPEGEDELPAKARYGLGYLRFDCAARTLQSGDVNLFQADGVLVGTFNQRSGMMELAPETPMANLLEVVCGRVKPKTVVTGYRAAGAAADGAISL